MKPSKLARRLSYAASLGLLLIMGFAGSYFATDATAGPPWFPFFRQPRCTTCSDVEVGSDVGGSWFWMRSPEQEKVVAAGLFNRYCIRCHGSDGKGVWDIPGIPNFTDARWQAYRSDDQIARIIIEGRGAVMPPFRGVLSLEEAFALARHLRRTPFVPGTEISRPDFSPPAKTIVPKVEPPKMELPKMDVPKVK